MESEKNNQEFKLKTKLVSLPCLKIIVPAVLVIFTLVTGTIGFHRYYKDNECVTCKENQRKGGQEDASEYSLNLFSLNSGCPECDETWTHCFWMATGLPIGENVVVSPYEIKKLNIYLTSARFSGYLIIIYAFLAVVRNAAYPLWKNLVIGMWSSRLFRKKYAVVCGLGWRGRELTIDLLKRKYRVVAIDNDKDNPFLNELTGKKGVYTFAQAAHSETFLKQIRILKAHVIFVTAGSSESNDEINYRIARQIARLAGTYKVHAFGKKGGGKKVKMPVEAPCMTLVNKTRQAESFQRCHRVDGQLSECEESKAGSSGLPGKILRGQTKCTARKLRMLTRFSCGLKKACVKCERVRRGPLVSLWYRNNKEKTRIHLPSLFVHTESRKVRGNLENELRESKLQLRCFNTFETTVRQLLRQHPRIFKSETKESENVHLVVFGDSEIARALIRQILTMMHLRKGREVQLDIVVPDIDEAKKYWYNRFACLNPDNWIEDLALGHVARPLFKKVKFHQLPRDPSELMKDDFVLHTYDKDEGWQIRAFFCLDDGVKSYGVLNSCRVPHHEKGGKHKIQFYIYYNYPEGELTPHEAVEDDTVIQFGSFCELCSFEAIEDDKTLKMARAISMAYAKNFEPLWDWLLPQRSAANLNQLQAWDLGKKYKESPILNYMGCMAQERWNHVPGWDRDSNISQADHLWIKLQDLGFDTSKAIERQALIAALSNEESCMALQEAEHDRWSVERLLGGWRPMSKTVVGKAKEASTPAERKQIYKEAKKRYYYHLDLVPFGDLSPAVKYKDKIPVLGIPAILDAIGYIKDGKND